MSSSHPVITPFEYIHDGAELEIVYMEFEFVLEPPRIEKRNDFIYDEYDLDDFGEPLESVSYESPARKNRRTI